jgi:isopentenyl-diphosphate Delta-isomerase
MAEQDPNAVARKKDHIELAFKSRIEAAALDGRFYYEPMLAPHPDAQTLPVLDFLGKSLRAPLWVSSMTGGTAMANVINHNLARACRQFGMGMGLGSCRQLLYSDEHLPDFDVRDAIGADLPLFANLGVAQVEQLFEQGEQDRIFHLLEKLRADGLIIHVNPLQEAMQPEGDIFKTSPVTTIRRSLELLGRTPLIVKEVGQGFGPASIRALLEMPLSAVEFAAGGGVNFAKLELLRSDEEKQEVFGRLATVGHSAAEMVQFVNEAVAALGEHCRVEQIIISGGVKDFLDGYYLIQKSNLKAVYGQASGFLLHARGEYEALEHYVEAQLQGLRLAYAYLKAR